MAAAQASGLPMKVGPCISACSGFSEPNASNTCRRATAADSAMVPPVSALDRVTMSGTIPAASQANIVPVRPNPVKISSRISSSPCRSASRRSRRSTSGGWNTMPPAPCTSGSTSNAAISWTWRARNPSSVASAASSRGSSARWCRGSTPANRLCMPSSGSHTAMVAIVSP